MSSLRNWVENVPLCFAKRIGSKPAVAGGRFAIIWKEAAENGATQRERS